MLHYSPKVFSVHMIQFLNKLFRNPAIIFMFILRNTDDIASFNNNRITYYLSEIYPRVSK